MQQVHRMILFDRKMKQSVTTMNIDQKQTPRRAKNRSEVATHEDKTSRESGS